MKNFPSHSPSFLRAVGFAAIMGLGACASQQTVSPEQLAASEGPTRAAEEAGAAKIPNAALYLKLAREEIELGKELAAKEDPRAATVLLRAEADAELALALAQSATAENEAKALTEEAKAAKN